MRYKSRTLPKRIRTSRSRRLTIALALAAGVLASGGCGFRTALYDQPDASQSAAPDTYLRIPQRHRPIGATCPLSRGAGPFTCACPSADGSSCVCPGDTCGRDLDCRERRNGRCIELGPLSRPSCSFDECMRDTDCPSGVPCDCRESVDSYLPNTCLTGSDCRINGDCGPGGFCSPSRFGQWCGTTYHCHKPSDTCLDDSDCAGKGCNFDTQSVRWSCGGDCGPPSP